MLFPEPWTNSDMSFWWISKGLCSPPSLATPQSKGVREMVHWQLLRALEVKGFTVGWHKWSKPASCSRPPPPIETSPDLHIRFLMLWMVLAHMTCQGRSVVKQEGSQALLFFCLVQSPLFVETGGAQRQGRASWWHGTLLGFWPLGECHQRSPRRAGVSWPFRNNP